MDALLLTFDPGIVSDGQTAQLHAFPSIAKALDL